LHRYCRLSFDHLAIDDENNALVLRKDLHQLFDTRRLILAAKRPSGDDQSSQLVVHILLPHGSAQLIPLYHNRLLKPVTGVASQFLFARFAWAIFTDENIPFFHDEHKYAVLLFDPATGHMTNENLQGRQVQDRANIFGPFSRSRSVSPKKRCRLDETNRENAMIDELCKGWGEDCSLESTDIDEEGRGRPRKRRRESIPGLARDSVSAASSMATSDHSEAIGPSTRSGYPEKEPGNTSVTTIVELAYS